jgi:glycogen(starch) synthase
VAGLAAAAAAVLADPAAAAHRARAATERLGSDFDWANVAAGTAAVYASATARGPLELGRPKIPTGNVFGR